MISLLVGGGEEILANFTVIGDVSLELRRQLFQSLDSATELDFNATMPSSSITLDPPDDADAGNGALASLYLYHIAPSRHLRNQRPLPDPISADRFRNPPVPLELRYLLTPLGSEATANHALIGRVIQHVADSPSFDTLSGAVMGDAFGGGSAELRLSVEPLGFEQMAQLWSAFNAPYRLSIVLMVEVVAIDSALPATRITRATEAVMVTGVKR